MPNNFKIQCVPKHFSWKPNISQGDLREKKKRIYVNKVWETFTVLQFYCAYLANESLS